MLNIKCLIIPFQKFYKNIISEKSIKEKTLYRALKQYMLGIYKLKNTVGSIQLK